ncbi:MAG: hypothetical protein RMK91_11595 [Pseudanabaenaceae cyanobacterium SKYGB_i_bin29]|nr:hypothetical protein [Pseudanabaenaceae cyanobacterium SKYG29]MDW8422497.1 hypothetical protein [Pseudanabaenaceae cyanobacterium SKYGB_i_bin29]
MTSSPLDPIHARLNNHEVLINQLIQTQATMNTNITLLTEILQRVVDQQERHNAEMQRLHERLDAQEGQLKVLIDQFLSGFNLQTLREIVQNFDSKFEEVFRRLEENDRRFKAVFQRLAEHDLRFDQMLQELQTTREEMRQERERSDARFNEMLQRLDEQDEYIRSMLELLQREREN